MNIGCDIIKNSRIKIDNIPFIEKVLTEKEINVFNKLSPNEKRFFLAGRFAAKEAIIKAYNGNINMQEISILKNENGSPAVITEKPYDIKLSISHEEEYTIAYAILID